MKAPIFVKCAQRPLQCLKPNLDIQRITKGENPYRKFDAKSLMYSLIDNLGLDRWGVFVPRSPLLIKVTLELLALCIDGIILRPILVAILEDQSNIVLELPSRGVFVPLHLTFDSRQVHGLLDDFKIIGDIVEDWVNRVSNTLHKARPVARAKDHARYHATAEVKILLWRQGTRLVSRALDLTLAANRFRAARLLLDDRLNFVWVIRTSGETNIRFSTAFGRGAWWVKVDFVAMHWLHGRLMSGALRCESWSSGKLTHDDDKLAEYLLGKGLGERVTSFWRRTH